MAGLYRYSSGARDIFTLYGDAGKRLAEKLSVAGGISRTYASAQTVPVRGPSYIHNVGLQPLKWKTIGGCLEEAANRWPDRHYVIASQETQKRLSFSQILEQADALAAGLAECGLRPGDRLGVWSPNSSRWIVSMMAAARAGLVLVAINPAYQQRELEYCLRKVGVRGLLVPSVHKNQQYAQMLNNLIPELANSKPGELAAANLPDLKTVVLMDDHNMPGTFTYSSVMNMGKPSSIQSIQKMKSLIHPDDGCNIQFTSGTTGQPKAAYMSHFNYVNNGFLIGKRNQLADMNHKICVQVPLFHAYGLVIVVMASLQYGSSLVFPSASYNPEETIKAIIKERCTILTGTPTMYVDLLTQLEKMGTSLTSPQLAIVGGSPCSPELFNRMTKLGVSKIKSVFGMTETSAVIFQSMRDETPNQVTDTVGHIQEHMEAQVVDPTGKVVPFGTPGELMVRGYCNMLQYWDDEKKTIEMMGPNKWLRTGDQFILQEDGYGRVVGRLKDVIIRGGENVYPKEIEDFLNTHPAIVEAHVFGIKDDRLGEEICVAVRSKEGSSLDLKSLQQHCSGKLAAFKVPRYLRLVQAFPRTASGKIQKFRLREMMEAGEL